MDQKNNMGNTALHVVAEQIRTSTDADSQKIRIDIVTELLENGADVSITNNEGKTAYDIIIPRLDDDYNEFLKDVLDRLNPVSVFILACSLGELDKVKKYIDNGGDINATGASRSTGLMMAIFILR